MYDDRTGCLILMVSYGVYNWFQDGWRLNSHRRFKEVTLTIDVEEKLEIPESQELNIFVTCSNFHKLIPAIWSHVVVIPQFSIHGKHIFNTHKGMLKLNLKNRRF